MKLNEEHTISDINTSTPLSLEEAVAYVNSFGVMSKDELLEWGYNKIDEIWEEKHGSIQQPGQGWAD